jgi:plasmid stability protein
MEEEVRQILRHAVREEKRPASKLGSRIAARFAKVGFTGELPRLPDETPRPAKLGK